MDYLIMVIVFILKGLARQCILNRDRYGIGYRTTGLIYLKDLEQIIKVMDPGILRKIPEEAMDEIRKIFEVTGGLKGLKRLKNISKKKAEEMNLELDEGIDNEYFRHIYTNK